jgi:predicted methyltransferase
MHFTVEAQRMIRQYYQDLSADRSLIAIDATAGNGYDTAFLAQLVGESGRVLAIDIQACAIAEASRKVESRGLGARVDWHCGCHSQVAPLLDDRGIQQVDVAMFNLGYLPRGDRTLATQAETSLAALQAVWPRLKPNSLLSIISYPAHTGGNSEHQVVSQWIEQLSGPREGRCQIRNFREPGDPRSPEFWLIEKLTAA